MHPMRKAPLPLSLASVVRALLSAVLVLGASACAQRAPVAGTGGPARADAGTAAPTLTIYLARHGQTAWNAEHRMQGWTDTPLDATGLRQAEGLRDFLRGVHLDRVYSSTLSRSRT